MKQPSLATHKKPDHFDQLPLVRNKLIQFRRGLIFANDYIPIEKQFRQKHRQANPCAKEQYLQKSWDETKNKTKSTSLNLLFMKKLTSADLPTRTSPTRTTLQSCLNLLKRCLMLLILCN